LEASHGLKKLEKAEKDSEENLQLSFFNLDDPLLEALRDEIKSLDIDTLTPVEALMQLNQIKRRLS
jgi:DNA mismatch repair protein MutS